MENFGLFIIYLLLTFRFGCRHRREDTDAASLDRDDAAANRKDSAAVDWLQLRSTFQSRSHSNHGSIVAPGSRKGDSVWVVALLGREQPSSSLLRWLSQMGDR